MAPSDGVTATTFALRMLRHTQLDSIRQYLEQMAVVSRIPVAGTLARGRESRTKFRNCGPRRPTQPGWTTGHHSKSLLVDGPGHRGEVDFRLTALALSHVGNHGTPPEIGIGTNSRIAVSLNRRWKEEDHGLPAL